MNKQEYMQKLNEALIPYDEALRQEIINDFEEHFDCGVKAGVSEETIIASLGSVEEVIANLDEPVAPQKITKTLPAIRASQINSLVIDTEDTGIDVELVATDETEVRYELEQNFGFFARKKELDLFVDVTQTEEKLLLTVRSGHEDRGYYPNTVLLVEVPKSIEICTVKNSSGDVDVSGVTVGLLELISSSGDLSVEKTVTQLLKLKTVSGDIEVNDVQGNLIMETKSGDADASHILAQKADISTASGDIEVQGSVQRLHTKSASGDIDCITDDQLLGLVAESASGDVEILLATGCSLKGEAVSRSGDVSVSSALQGVHYGSRRVVFSEGRTVLSVQSASGDIDISTDGKQYRFERNDEEDGDFSIHVDLGDIDLSELKNLGRRIAEEVTREVQDGLDEINVELKRAKNKYKKW